MTRGTPVLRRFIAWAQAIPRIFLILSLGLLHGVLYLLLVPPWQHYDEPTQFEYAWLIANRGRLPEANEFDAMMRREVAASMVEHNFFVNLPAPNLLLDQPWIGISQTNDQPLYYLISAIPLWFLRGSDITFQLYVVRTVSLGMFLLTIWLSYKIVVEVFPRREALHWLIPAALATTPSFVDLMTAVNNDVGATLIFSVFLWCGTRVFTRGRTLPRLVLLCLLALGCYWTKNTVFIAIPSVMVLLLLTISQARPPWKRGVWPALLISLVAAGGILFLWGDAAYWYRSQYLVHQTMTTRSQRPALASNSYALQIQALPEETGELNLQQPLTTEAIASLRGQPYTLGAWMWASVPIQAQAPALMIDGTTSPETVSLTQTPGFFAITGRVPDNASQLRILLDPLAASPEQPVSIYFDDIVLVKGEYPLNSVPTFAATKMSGTWNAQPFVNLVRNPSAERGWVIFHPRWLAEIRTQTAIPVYALPAMQDFALTSGTYQFTLKNLLESFWAKFGWGHVRLPEIVYGFLRGFTLIGGVGAIAGSILAIIKKRTTQSVFLFLWFAFNLFFIWFAALARQTLPFWDANPFTPSARYAYPAMIPTMLLIMSGWYFLGRQIPKMRILSYLPIAILVILDITALVTISRFYNSI